MRITEIYLSIQGESRFAGLPCIFVRTTGCNLRCSWCDTEYAFYGGQKMTPDEIIQEVQNYECKLVELTGGEPLLQKDIPELAHRLIDLGYTVLIETSGERDISVLDQRVIKIMDLKCPGSGESDKNRWQNLNHLSLNDEVKFVIKDRQDYEWTLDVIRSHHLEGRVRLIISPVYGEINHQDIVQWMLKDSLQVRFQLQMHKFIWSPETHGV